MNNNNNNINNNNEKIKIKIIKNELIDNTFYILYDENNKNKFKNKRYLKLYKKNKLNVENNNNNNYKENIKNKEFENIIDEDNEINPIILEIKDSYNDNKDSNNKNNKIYISKKLSEYYNIKNKEKYIFKVIENITIFNEVILIPKNETSLKFFEKNKIDFYENELKKISNIFSRDTIIKINNKDDEIDYDNEENKDDNNNNNNKKKEEIEFFIIETIPSLTGIINNNTIIKIFENFLLFPNKNLIVNKNNNDDLINNNLNNNNNNNNKNLIIDNIKNNNNDKNLLMLSSFISIKEKNFKRIKLTSLKKIILPFEYYSNKYKIDETSIGFFFFYF
jgi:hypothetical protein